MESPQFIKCKKDDWEALMRLSALTFKNAFGAQNDPADMEMYMEKAFSQEKIVTELANEFSTFYFVNSGEVTVGYFKLNVETAQTEPIVNGLEIERIYILSAYQSLGIGQLMLDKIFQLARKMKKFHIWLGVWDQNEGAIRFYRRNGFKKFAQHSFLLGTDLQMDLLMELTLNHEE